MMKNQKEREAALEAAASGRDRLKDEYDAASGRLKELEDNKDKLEAMAKGEHDANEQLKAALDKAEKDLEEAQEGLTDAKSRLADEEALILKKQQSIDNANQLLSKMRDDEGDDEVEEALEAIEEELRAAGDALNRKDARIALLEKQPAELKKDDPNAPTDALAKLAMLEDKCLDLETELKLHTGDFHDPTSDPNEDLTEVLKRKDALIKTLQDRIAALEADPHEAVDMVKEHLDQIQVPQEHLKNPFDFLSVEYHDQIHCPMAVSFNLDTSVQARAKAEGRKSYRKSAAHQHGGEIDSMAHAEAWAHVDLTVKYDIEFEDHKEILPQVEEKLKTVNPRLKLAQCVPAEEPGSIVFVFKSSDFDEAHEEAVADMEHDHPPEGHHVCKNVQKQNEVLKQMYEKSMQEAAALLAKVNKLEKDKERPDDSHPDHDDQSALIKQLQDHIAELEHQNDMLKVQKIVPKGDKPLEIDNALLAKDTERLASAGGIVEDLREQAASNVLDSEEFEQALMEIEEELKAAEEAMLKKTLESESSRSD
eukprot:TRINITY_DN5897_c0_g1_i2.p1 TRINITY_DN5897_c0_g1~~TRINITY_DN5897_c0_g1_i2.p1  ORF type:complete len:550 (-),score=197.47 TRINITY_DN5897_c0_g1_i2:265-1875(-)